VRIVDGACRAAALLNIVRHVWWQHVGAGEPSTLVSMVQDLQQMHE
jgi:hypothetical protein